LDEPKLGLGDREVDPDVFEWSAVSLGTISTEIGIWPPFNVLTEIDATANLMGVETCAPNDDTVISSCLIGDSWSILANSSVINEC